MKLRYLNRNDKERLLTVDRVYEDDNHLVGCTGHCDCYKNTCDCVKYIRIPKYKVLEVIEGETN